jgi:hypothetical protein
VSNSIESAVESIIETITQDQPKSKRSIATTVAKFGWKYAAPAAAVIGFGYQEKQLHDMTHEMDHLESQINTLHKEQALTLLKNKLLTYTEEVKSIIDATLSKYQRLLHHQPMNEINNFMLLNFPSLKIQKNSKNYEPKIKRKNDLIIIEYQIPTVSNEEFSHILIVSVPDENNAAIKFNEGNNFIQVLKNNATIYQAVNTSMHKVFTAMNLDTLVEKCIENIVYHMSTDTCVKEKFKLPTTVIKIQDSDELLIINENANASIICNGVHTRITEKIFIIRQDRCSIQNGQEIEAELMLTEKWMEKESNTIQPALETESFNLMQQIGEHLTIQNSTYYFITICITIIIITSIIWWKRRNAKSFNRLKTKDEHVLPHLTAIEIINY